jgi:hypothetical protein
MLHWCCMSGQFTTIFVPFPIIANVCYACVVYLVVLRLFFYYSLLLIIVASLVFYVWSDFDYFWTIPCNWLFMLHWCCMCGRIATIFVLFLMADNLCFTGVVCLVGLQLFFHCYLWLIIDASLVLYVWSDYDYFALFPIIDNLCITGVVYLVGLRLFSYCSLWLIIYASLVLYI